MIFAGPTILKSTIVSYSSGQLRPYSITVTPNLNIEIGRLEYTLVDPNARIDHEGFSRSVKVSWSIFGEQPFIQAQVGPTLIADTFRADQLNLFTPSLSEIDFKKILINGEISNLDIFSIYKSESLTVKAVYEGDKNLLDSVSVDLAAVTTYDPHAWVLHELNVNINKLDLNAPIDEQPVVINVSAAEVENIQNSLIFFDLDGAFIISDRDIEFQVSSKDLTNKIYDKIRGAINAKGVYTQNGWLKKSQIEFYYPSDVLRASDQPRVSVDVLGIEDGTYEIRALANMSSFELNIGDKFIGTLPTSSFKIDLFVNDGGSKINGISKFSLNKKGTSEITGKADVNFELHESSNIIDCLMSNCEITSFELYNKLSVDEQWFSVISKCHSPPCNMSSTSHVLKTSNTVEIFSSINQSKILNPLYSIYLYNVINGGKKVENGHEVFIN